MSVVRLWQFGAWLWATLDLEKPECMPAKSSGVQSSLWVSVCKAGEHVDGQFLTRAPVKKFQKYRGCHHSFCPLLLIPERPALPFSWETNVRMMTVFPISAQVRPGMSCTLLLVGILQCRNPHIHLANRLSQQNTPSLSPDLPTLCKQTERVTQLHLRLLLPHWIIEQSWGACGRRLVSPSFGNTTRVFLPFSFLSTGLYDCVLDLSLTPIWCSHFPPVAHLFASAILQT